MNVTQIKDFTDRCTGCCACINSCLVGAIKMSPDKEGFSYPFVLIDICTDCGICVQNCQIVNYVKNLNNYLTVYYGRAKKVEDVMDGSSGGIFPAIAKKLLSEGAIIFGACFEQTGDVIHKSSLNTDLKKLFRSKYVQSDIGFTYSDVESLLKKKKTVLFCGTPCQIQGLYNFLNCNYEHLYTIDFICHGVPSPGIFKDMLKFYATVYNCNRISWVDFRAKTNGWRNQTIDIYDEFNQKHTYISKEHPYFYSFINNYSLRKSCFTCNYTKTHASDLTIADYWKYSDRSDDKGMSIIVVNTIKGESLLKMTDSLLYLVPLKLKSIVDLFMDRDKKVYSIKKRNAFFNLYTSHGYKKTMNYIKREMVIKRIIRAINDIVKVCHLKVF